MIYSVKGKIELKSSTFAVLDVGGLGLKIFMHDRGLHALGVVGDTAHLFCHLQVKEDALDLYGFLDEHELRFFELLISVSGVGPRSALSILHVADLGQLAAAIKEGRPDVLTRASGIGRKTAERVIVELRSKVKSEQSAETVKKMETDSDLVEVLTNLGYRREEARVALGKVDEKIVDLEARLKMALKILAGR